MSEVAPPIPLIEDYPVLGEPGAVTVQAGGVMDTSHLLAGQGQQITTISGSLAPSWNGEAAAGYHALSARVASAFAHAATDLEGAATLMIRYAADLERLQAQERTAAHESSSWHDQIVTWTGKLNQAQTDLTRAQTDLTTAQGQYAAAAALGPKGVGAAAQASAAATRARLEVQTAEHELTTARRQLSRAHQEFTHWQDRGRSIRDAANTSGDELAAALLLITIIPPPLPGTPDYPALEPTPGFLVNDDPGDEDKQGQGDDKQGEGDKGSGDDARGNGEKGDGDKKPEPEPPKIVVRPDGTIVQPPRPEIKTGMGDGKEAQEKAAREVQRAQEIKPRDPLWAVMLHLWSRFFPGSH